MYLRTRLSEFVLHVLYTIVTVLSACDDPYWEELMGVVCWWPGPLLDHHDVICLGHGSGSPHHESGHLRETLHFQTLDLQSLCQVVRETEWEAALVAKSFP